MTKKINFEKLTNYRKMVKIKINDYKKKPKKKDFLTDTKIKYKKIAKQKYKNI